MSEEKGMDGGLRSDGHEREGQIGTLTSGAAHHSERSRLWSTPKQTNHTKVMSKPKVFRVASIRKQISVARETIGVCVAAGDPKDLAKANNPASRFASGDMGLESRSIARRMRCDARPSKTHTCMWHHLC